MAARLVLAAVSIIVLASAADAAFATVTEYTDQTAFNAAISNSTSFNFDGLVPPGTLSFGDVTLGDLSFTASGLSIPMVIGSNGSFFGGSPFFTAFALAPGGDPSVLLCTLAGSTALGFTYGDLDLSGGLPLTVTLSTGDSFNLTTPPNPAVDTGFVGFVSNTPITSVTFSDYSEGFAVLQVAQSGATGVPEPGTFALLAAGLLSLAVFRPRRALQVERAHGVRQPPITGE
jgi:hypothetical protein